MGEEGPGRKRRKRYEAPVIWLWFAGRDLDEEGGKGRTNATWLQPATRVFHPTGHAGRWSRMAHWKRSAIRQCAVLGSVLAGWDAYFHAPVTVTALSLLTVIYGDHVTGAALLRPVYGGQPGKRGVRKFFPVRHYWQYVRPLTFTLKAELGLVPTHLQIEPDHSKVILGLPHEWMGSDNERAAITQAIQEKVGIEEPEASWNLRGRNHHATFLYVPPPPGHLWWDEIEPHILEARYDELVCGIGRSGQVVKASIESDSPMFGIGMGSGGGKTNLLAFWLAQRLRLGDMGYMIDGKRFSHPYLFKDMDARRDQLPNIGYVRRIDDIHRGLVRLGRELAERNERAEHYINAKGKMLGFVGHRLWIGLEELNLVVPLLKIYWGHERERLVALFKDGQIAEKPPRQSPALVALSQLAFAGRQVGIHLIFVGQRLDADVLGATGSQGGAVRGNINVRALARYDEAAWKMQAGSVPMPPPPSVTGRIQLWVGGRVSETQVPEMDYEQVRGLAVSGDITKIPADWPGVAKRDQRALPRVPVLHPDTVIPPGQDPIVLGRSTRPPGMRTIREAMDEGIFNGADIEAIRQRVKRAKKKGRIQGGTYDGRSELFSPEELVEVAR
jgi:hypothetical protein